MKRPPSISQFLLDQADISQNIVCIINKNTEFVYFNRAWLAFREASLEEEGARLPHEYIHADDVNSFLADVAAVGLRKEPCVTECRLRNGKGKAVWFSFVVSPIFSLKGTCIASIAYGHTVAAKKMAEENARRFSAIMTSVEAGIIIKDKQGRITEWSTGSQNIMGYTRDEILGQTSDIYTYRPNLKAIEQVNKLVDSGEHTSFIQTEVNHKDGQLIICSTAFSPIFGANGEVNGSVVIFHDVTAEKMAEKKRLEAEMELQRSHNDIAAILNESPVPLCVTSEDHGIVVGCNPAFSAMCLSTEAEILGGILTDYFQSSTESDCDTVESLLNRLRTKDNFVCRLKKRDGSVANVEVVGRPFYYHEQNAFAVHCVDVTKREKHAQALQEAVLAAEDASKMKSTFLANMSHEIRTPLNGVIGFAELALDAPDISEALRNYLKKIKISANGLLEIINDVLDISKIEAGKIDIEEAPFDLHTDILHACETIIGERAKEKNVILYLYSEPVVKKNFVGDQTRLRQILLNLLSNAVKFTNVGIVKLMLSVEEETERSSTIYFEIKDSGIGMTPEQIQKIFDPFTQADSSTTRKFGGTGLGLAISRNLIELMGGKLQVQSAAGIGSRFSFSLTFPTIASTSLLQEASAPVQGTRTKPVFKGEVLICEDNVINQQVIQEHLTKLGLDTVITPNGKLGVEMVKQRRTSGQPFDLILMDIHMPVMDGLEATEKLHELGVKTPIIALTANAMTTDKQKYLSHGMDDYLAKPFKAYELWDCLGRHLTPLGEDRQDTQDSGAGQCFTAAVVPEAFAASFAPIVASFPATVPAAPLPPASPVIDRDLGIENAAGNGALYQRLLAHFLADNRNTHASICEALACGDYTLAHRMAHTLKSVAGTIGATALSRIACELETALTEENKDAAQSLVPSFGTMLDAVLRELATRENKSKSCEIIHCFDRAKALELIKKLEPLLRAADSECIEYLDSVTAFILPMGEIGQQFANQIADYDFDLALATLDEINSCLGDKI